MGMKRVVIDIDRLVLKGFGYENRHAIALGLQEELASVFGDREAAQRLSAVGDVSRLQVGSVRIERGATPQRIGGNVARGITREIKR
jgi:hypothetical protein